MIENLFSIKISNYVHLIFLSVYMMSLYESARQLIKMIRRSA